MPTFTPACRVGFVKQSLDQGFLLKSSSSSPKLLRVGVTPEKEASCCSLWPSCLHPCYSPVPNMQSLYTRSLSVCTGNFCISSTLAFFWLTLVHFSNQFPHQFIRKKIVMVRFQHVVCLKFIRVPDNVR